MKVTPIASTITSQTLDGQAPNTAVQKLRMKTQATPLTQGNLPQENQPVLQQPAQQLTSDNSSQAEVAQEGATQPLSPQLALLAKQRRALQVKERELKARERELAKQAGAHPSVDLARLKSEPISVLLENGVTYQQLADAIASGQGGNSEIYALKQKIAALEQGIDQKLLDKDKAAEQQALAQMRRDATAMVQGSDEYELVRATNSIPHVMKLIERTYRESGEVLDVQEALKLVEDELLKDAQKLQTLKKLQMQQASPLLGQPQREAPGMRTLTNKHTASVPMSAKQRALAAFYGTLQR